MYRDPEPAAAPDRYGARASVSSGWVDYRLEPDHLRVDYRDSGEVRKIPYASVQRVTLFGSQQNQICTLKAARNKVRISSSSFVGIANFRDQTPAYLAFLQELHNRLAQTANPPRMRVGYMAVYLISCLAAVLALALPVVIKVLATGRPRDYRPEELPELVARLAKP